MRLGILKLGGFLMLMGVTVAVIGTKVYLDKSKLSGAGVEAMAEVLRLDTFESSSEGGSPNYSIRIQLPDTNKTEASIPMTRETRNKYQVGEKLKVVYDPEKPTNADIGSKEELGGNGFLTILGVLFGLLSTGAGFFVIVRHGYSET